jgi:hypothetical protein
VSDKDSKPGGILQIPDSLGRDLDKAAAGKIAPPPIEAFMSDAALEQAEKNTRAASEPVHAEDLKPISQAEAAVRTTFGGAVLPSLPAPRRVIPAPFQRPSVRGGSHGKSWHENVRADQVRAGDIIPDVGRVTRVDEYVTRETVAGVGDVATGVEVALTGAGGVVRVFDCAAPVRVFRS